MGPTQRRIKRLADVVIAVAAIAATAPLWALAGVLIIVESGRPVLFRAARVGQHGEPFVMFKFRSMTTGPSGARVTAGSDTRITRVGAWLRRYKLDELPQLLNIVRAEMSIVGPRPEDPHFVAMYSESQRQVLQFRPGIVSPAILEYLDEQSVLDAMASPEETVEQVYVNHIMGPKIQTDLDWFEHETLVADFRLMMSLLKRTRSTRS